MKSLLSIFLCLLSLTFSVLFISASQQSEPVSANNAIVDPTTLSENTPRYIILIDGGSTGSRAHVHRYFPSRSPTILPQVEVSVNKKIKPGLSSYAPEPSKAKESIKELIDFVKTVVPKEQWTITPIHLHATAGLRSVTPTEAENILLVVRDELSRSPFVFKRHWAKVISGEQEGINGWVAVNYLNGFFDPQPANQVRHSTGVVEMGGSSMQITFAPNSNLSPSEKKQLHHVTLAGQNHYLYTHSFLQYGLQAAEKLFQKISIDNIEETGNPCYPKNFRHSSTGDFMGCLNLLENIIDKSKNCGLSHCSFNGVFQPPITQEKFFAIENFFYTAQFFGQTEEEEERVVGNQLVHALKAKGKEFCDGDFRQLRTQYPNTPPKELATFCFSAAYQSVVLERGLGFSSTSAIQIKRTVGGKSIDWELGAVLFELEKKEDVDDTVAKTNNVYKAYNSYKSLVPPSQMSCKSCYVWMAFVLFLGFAACYLFNRFTVRNNAVLNNYSSYAQSAFGKV